MDRTMLLTVLLVGIAGWLCAAVTVRSCPRRSGSVQVWSLSAILAAVLAPAAMVVGAQFGPPKASALWTAGLVAGALGSLAGAYIPALGRRRRTSPIGITAAITASPFAAVAAIAGALLWAKDSAAEALAAFSVGWLGVSLALACCRPQYGAPDRSAPDAAPPAWPAEAFGPGFAVTLAATAALGIYRGSEADALRWASSSVAFAASAPVALLLGSAAASLIRRGRGGAGAIIWQAFLSAGFLAAVTAILGRRVFEGVPLSALIAMGLGLGFGLWWLAADLGGDVPAPVSTPGLAARLGMPVAVLLVLGAFMAAFSLSAGYGVGLMLLAAWLVFALAALRAASAAESSAARDSPPGDQGGDALWLAALSALAIMLLVFRLITTRFDDDLRGVVLTDHFALVGLLAGAALPSMLSGLIEPAGVAGGGWRVIRFMVSLAVAGAVPGIMLAVWGSKIALALVAGLALSTVASSLAGGPAMLRAVLAAVRNASVAGAAWVAPWYALIIAAALAAWMHPIAQIATRSRADRVRLLSWALAGLIAAVVVSDVGGRIAARRGRGKLRRAEPLPSGGAE